MLFKELEKKQLKICLNNRPLKMWFFILLAKNGKKVFIKLQKQIKYGIINLVSCFKQANYVGTKT